jgi:pimeloyl-ACP methyl ester carboxylesterase
VSAGERGAPLGYRILGNPRARKTLLLVPSSLFNHRQWDGMAKALRHVLPSRYKIVMFDYPGAGLSAQLNPLDTDAPMAQWLDKVFEVIGHLKLEQVDLFGYSLGADMAIALASDPERRVRTVYNYGTPFPSPDDATFTDHYQKGLGEFDRLFENRRMRELIGPGVGLRATVNAVRDVQRVFCALLHKEEARAGLTRQLGRHAVGLVPGWKDKYLDPNFRDALLRTRFAALFTKHVLEGNRLGYLRSLLERFGSAVAWQGDVDTLVRSLEKFPSEVRLRLAVGENDDQTPPWMTRQVAKMVPHAEVVEIKGGTHWSPSLNPIKMLEIARDVRRFVIKGQRFDRSLLRWLRNNLKVERLLSSGDQLGLVKGALAALERGEPAEAIQLAREARAAVPQRLLDEAAAERKWWLWHRQARPDAPVAGAL